MCLTPAPFCAEPEVGERRAAQNAAITVTRFASDASNEDAEDGEVPTSRTTSIARAPKSTRNRQT